MSRALVRVAALASALLGIAATARGGDPPTALVAPTPPWLGVTMDAGGDIGVPVVHVVRGSPADKGGLRAGDRIVSVDGAQVGTAADVTRNVQSHKVGDALSLQIERGGSAVTAQIPLAARPSGDDILRMDLVGAPAPPWSNITPLAGAPASLSRLRGKVVLVDFWASWCGPCRMLAPKLTALRDRFGAQGLAVVGLTSDDAERAAVFAERNGIKYPIVVDKDGETQKTYGVTNLPTMLLVDKKGVVREVFIGYDPALWGPASGGVGPAGDAKLEALVKALLAEPAPAK